MGGIAAIAVIADLAGEDGNRGSEIGIGNWFYIFGVENVVNLKTKGKFAV